MQKKIRFLFLFNLMLINILKEIVVNMSVQVVWYNLLTGNVVNLKIRSQIRFQ